MVQTKLRRPESAGRLEKKLKSLQIEARRLEGQMQHAFERAEYDDTARRLRAVHQQISDIEEILDR